MIAIVFRGLAIGASFLLWFGLGLVDVVEGDRSSMDVADLDMGLFTCEWISPR